MLRKLSVVLLFVLPLLAGCPEPTPTEDGGTTDAGTLPPPNVTGITPTEGPLEGGQSVAITGENFVEGAKVHFGATESPNVTFNSARRLVARSPAATTAGPVSIVVTNPDGQSVTVDDGYVYQGTHAPSIRESRLVGDATITDTSGADPVLFTIRGDVQVPTVTTGAGKAEGLRAQVGVAPLTSSFALGDLVWSEAQYVEDADLSPGDKEFDRYSGQVSVPGATGNQDLTYVLAARFSTDNGASWVIADLDGSMNGTTVAQLQKLVVARNGVDWCKLGGQTVEAPPVVNLKLGQMGPTIYAQVYEAGVTNASGAGAGITLQLGYGPAGSNPESAQGWTWTTATYNVDTGSGANDEYQATLPNPGDGTFAFAYRAQVAGGPWRYCDANGSDNTNGYDPAQAGTLNVAAASVDKCKVQFPSTLETRTGLQSDKVYGWVWAQGITDAAGQGATIVAELGYGLAGTQPDNSWTWVPATYNVDKDNGAADEYEASFPGPAAGAYHYAYRFSVGSGPKTYCDLDGSDVGGFTSAQAGVLTAKPVGIDSCTLQGPATISILGGQTTPAITGRVTAPSITDGMGQGAGIVGQVGYGAPGTQPNTWTWVNATYAGDQNMGQADEYTGTLSPMTLGTYKVGFRFQYQNNVHVYCDLDGSANGFSDTQAATLSVVPACKMEPVTLPNHGAPVSAAASGDPLEVHARVLLPGAPAPGIPTGLIGQVGLGTAGTDASSAPGWGWKNATFEADDSVTGEDVFSVGFHAGYTGSRAVSFRFSADNGQTWAYCDLDGNSNGYSQAQQAAVSVSNHSDVDYCKTLTSTVNQQVSTTSPATIKGEVYEAGVTDQGNSGNNIVVEWGFGKEPEDPGVAWTWYPATFDAEVGNNDVHRAFFNGPTTAGTWHYAFRFRRTAGTSWCFGDLDGAGANPGLTGFQGKLGNTINLGEATLTP